MLIVTIYPAKNVFIKENLNQKQMAVILRELNTVIDGVRRKTEMINKEFNSEKEAKEWVEKQENEFIKYTFTLSWTTKDE